MFQNDVFYELCESARCRVSDLRTTRAPVEWRVALRFELGKIDFVSQTQMVAKRVRGGEVTVVSRVGKVFALPRPFALEELFATRLSGALLC